MRLRRRTLISGIGVACGLLAACGGGVTERDQWTVWVTTNAPVPQLVDRVLIDILDDQGELACGDCRRQLGVPLDPAAWPISFGVAAPADGRPVRVRVRLYRAARAGTDGLPTPATSFDRVAALPTPHGNTDVQMILEGDCIGLASDVAQRLSCAATERALVPEAPLVPGKPDPSIRPGVWPRAASTPCSGAPDGMVCVPGGFFVLGDARDIGTGVGDNSSQHVERFVTVSPFAIDRDEMTVGTVRSLLAAGNVSANPSARQGPSSGQLAQCTYLGPSDETNDALPINCVPFDLAVQVCAAQGKRLPTEAEWEWAAGNESEETRYPWGDLGEPCDRADVGLGRFITEAALPEVYTCRVREGRPARDGGLPAASNPADVTALGVRRLAGGVSEWVSDRVASYNAPCWHPERPFLVDPRCDDDLSINARRLRGASWAGAPAFVSAAGREAFDPNTPLSYIGFRCAVSRGGATP